MNKSRITIILALASLLIFAVLCFNGLARLISEIDSREEVIGPREESYTFDPTTILNSLSEGNLSVFNLQIATPEPSISSRLSPVLWKQTDYLQITRAFYEEVLKNTLVTWSFNEFTFLAACKDAPMGPQIARFHLFKTESTHEKDSRLEYFIYVEPQKSQLNLVETEYYPNIHIPVALDLDRIIIPAESAMEIAENNGGQVFRNTVNNVCNISILKLENDWLVQYISDTSAFKVQIDDQNGDYKLVK